MPAFDFTAPVAISCQNDGNGATIGYSFTGTGTYFYASLLDDAGYGSTQQLGSDRSGSFNDVADGTYRLLVVDGQDYTTVERLVIIECDGQGGSSCNLGLAITQVVAPTVAGGQGYIECQVSTGGPGAELCLYSLAYPYGLLQQVTLLASGGTLTRRLLGLVAGDYYVRATDDNGCRQGFAVNLPEWTTPTVPPPVGPPIFYAVGGVLPNPVPLPLAVTYLAGRWVEVELLRDGATVATGRMTVRADNPTFDAAPYLRALLDTTPATAPTVAQAVDAAACAEFTYRYRTNDADGTVGAWAEATNQRRFAVLAALPDRDDVLSPWVADPTTAAPGAFTTAFAEPVQWLGFPLSIGILIPPGMPTPVFVEFRYYDGAGGVIEIRTITLPDVIEPGYHRFLLPSNPLPCAVRLEAQLVDEDRAYVGSCVGGGTAPDLPGGYILANNGGRLKV